MRQITRLEIGLLVAVLSLGFGLMYSAYQPRRENQSRATCQINLKQIGLALMQYSQDYDEHLPRAWFGRDAGPSDAKINYKWMDALQPYTPLQPKYFECPTDTLQKPYSIRDGANYGGYVINNAYFAKGDKLTPPCGQNLNRFLRPSMTILVTDGAGDFQFAWPNEKSAPTWTTASPRQLNSAIERHSGNLSLNTLFCDGHVSNYSSLQVFGERNLKGRKLYSGLTIEDD